MSELSVTCHVFTELVRTYLFLTLEELLDMTYDQFRILLCEHLAYFERDVAVEDLYYEIIDNSQELLGIFHSFIEQYEDDLDAADAVERWIKDEWMEITFERLELAKNVREDDLLFVKQLFDSALDQVDWKWMVRSEREEMDRYPKRKRKE